MDSSSGLEAYLFSENSETDPQPSQLAANMQYLQSSLAAFGFPALGDLFSTNTREIRQTITCIYALLQQKQRDLNYRTDALDRLQRLDSEKNMHQHKAEMLNEELSRAQSELGRAENLAMQVTKTSKQEREKILAERDELKREIQKMCYRETQFQHELKKREVAYKKLQEQLRKALGEKDVAYTNHFDIVQKVYKRREETSGESEFSMLVTRGLEANQTELLNENQGLRTALETLQKELHIMMDQRKELLQKRVDQGMESWEDYQLVGIRPEMFSMPFQSVSEDLVQTFLENMRRFKEFMESTTILGLGELFQH
jgi:X breakpoint 2-interacting protein